MKKIIVGTFESRPGAETLVEHLQHDLNVPKDDISFICRDAHGHVFDIFEGEEDESEELPKEMKAGSLIGGAIGAAAGSAMLLGFLPALGPIFSANSFVLAVGMTGSALGTLALGALIGAILGGVIASFFHSPKDAEEVQPLKKANEVLVVAHARNDKQVGHAFASHGASGVEIYTPTFA